MAAYPQKLEDAIIAAHEAGDTEAAQMLADELKQWQPKRAVTDDSVVASLKQLGKGALSGAADIGNTLINASTFVPRKLGDYVMPEGELSPLSQWNQNREQGLKSFNQDNEGAAFNIGRIGGNIAGTAGVGGVGGMALRGLSNTPKALALAEAIQSGGMGGGTLLNKILGGTTSGALGSLLIDPESTGYGAAVGGAIPVVGKIASGAGNVLAETVGGIGTRTGGESLKTAARAGMRGGKTAEQFTANMRGKVPITDALDTARANLQTMGAAKSAQYRSGMVDISNDKTVLDFAGIDKSLGDALNKVTFKGQVKNARGAKVYEDIADAVNEWKGLTPDDFHTPEGMDALKQKIGGIVESIPYEEKTARLVGRDVYNAVKAEINKQAPTYSKVMKEYADASESMQELEKALSLGNKASADTAMRKLQSLMRNNVNTNFGNRLDLAKKLESEGAREFLPAIAGQSLSAWTPRGLGGVVAGATGVGATMYPRLIPALIPQSPRLMGEAAYGLGQLGRGVKSVAPYPAGAMGGLLGRD